MAKQCPMLKSDCVEAKCAWWRTPDSCAVWDIPGWLSALHKQNVKDGIKLDDEPKKPIKKAIKGAPVEDPALDPEDPDARE